MKCARPLVSPSQPMPVASGHAMLEVCIASALLGLMASASLGATLLAQREASLVALRHNAIVLAAEPLEWAATGVSASPEPWRARVAAALPGGEGSLSGSTAAPRVTVRWRAPGVSDTRCPGLTCVVLGGGA